MKSILIHAWTLHKKDGEYYIPYTHWVYLKEIVKYYDKVGLLSPTKLNIENASSYESLREFSNIEVYELPYSDGYIDAVPYFFKYRNAYKKLAPLYSEVYARYPIPFGWLQKYYFKEKRRIIHFVGDPVDTIINNPSISTLKKQVYTLLFKPEHLMFMKACKGASVFTNGFHIAEKLKKYHIQASPLVSSTLSDNDFYFAEKSIDSESPRIVYVGYLRKAKGVETVLKSFAILQKVKPYAKLTIVGQGESEEQLKKIIENENIKNVTFKGHIDNRVDLNKILRENDIFCFASLSEGSPRVILEAMANGLAVVSTPVGSLPSTFVDEKEILFADFNKPDDFYSKILKLSENDVMFKNLRENSHRKVKQFTIDKFLKTIFYYE